MTNKPFAIFTALILSMCAFVAYPEAREAYYESKCENSGGVALWLAKSGNDQRHDGWTKPYCRINGQDVAQ